MLGGCATNPRAPAPNWSSAAVDPVEITDPELLPALCAMFVIEGADGVRYGTWTDACWNELAAYEIIAEGNTEIARANADALRKTEAGYNSLIKAGELQQEMTRFYEESLREEKSAHRIDNWMYKILMGLGLIAVAL